MERGKSSKEQRYKCQHKYLMRLWERAPWIIYRQYARSRCNGNHGASYVRKGIKCLLSIEDVKVLWFRDRAWLLKKATIDRIDSSKDYEIGNCRFLEHMHNSSRDQFTRPILQIDNSGKIIKRWPSVISAIRTLKINKGNIHRALHAKNATANGYSWKYSQRLEPTK